MAGWDSEVSSVVRRRADGTVVCMYPRGCTADAVEAVHFACADGSFTEWATCPKHKESFDHVVHNFESILVHEGLGGSVSTTRHIPVGRPT